MATSVWLRGTVCMRLWRHSYTSAAPFRTLPCHCPTCSSPPIWPTWLYCMCASTVLWMSSCLARWLSTRPGAARQARLLSWRAEWRSVMYVRWVVHRHKNAATTNVVFYDAYLVESFRDEGRTPRQHLL